MKKIISIFSLFIFSICFLKTHADSFMFKWEENTTFIDVPLNANIQNYLDIPKAFLYRNNELLEDAKINYITTGDWLYLLTDVDTTKVGAYQVWYKATENNYRPGQCPGYKTLVTFNVVDLAEPIFKYYPKSFNYRIGEKTPDYLSQITATDNSGNCQLSYDDSLVNYDMPGVYQVKILASDFINIATINIDVIVEDPIGPAITFLGESNCITINKGENINLISYFKAIDKLDGDVTSTISYKPFDTNVEQTFPLTVSFSDYSGNISFYEIMIEIIDQNTPLIELYSANVILEFNGEITNAIVANLKRAILGQENIINDIEIDYGNLKNIVGSYTISYFYTYKDQEYAVPCSVKILAINPPILLVNNIETKINIQPNYYNYISVIDESDPLITSKIQYDDSCVDYQTAATYPVSVSVVNSSNLSAKAILYVTIVKDEEDSFSNAFPNSNLLLIVGIIGLVGCLMLGFHFYKKRKNKLQ